MAKRSKHLGLGKAAKAKKQKVAETTEETGDESSASATPSNEITVELNEAADADDEMAQLKALWGTYSKSEKENELVLNGIIHECDRLLRNGSEDEKVIIPDYFHSIYALALSELALFHTVDEDSDKKIKEYFTAALERIELGLEANPESIDLLFAKSRILMNRIPLQYISQLKQDVTSKVPKLEKLLDEALKIYENAETKSESSKDLQHFNEENLIILEALDDLLDMVDNFGRPQKEDEQDDDDEEESGDGEDEVELPEDHPLYEIKNSDSYNQWWRDHTIIFLEKVNARESSEEVIGLRRELAKRLGQSYLQEAEIPSSVYTALTYDEGLEDVKELHGLTREQAQEISKELFITATKYFELAQDKDEPESWVPIAEAKISLGNLYELESEEQEKLYKDAEKILIKANKATQGKYQDILDNLQ
ncbi:enhancer of translation termination 1 [[Candida] anglica]|uniref:Enhancer of translation termination 1 n=1 Tax=[Candida] anglica TaxID=148631 RepID=A0ABP0EGB6_9ASCO